MQQKRTHLAFQLLSDQTPRTGAVDVDKNPFETTITSQPPHYLSRRKPVAGSNAEINKSPPFYCLHIRPPPFGGT